MRCNNLLPLAGPGVTDTAYEAALAHFYDNLQQLGPALSHRVLPPPAVIDNPAAHQPSRSLSRATPLLTRGVHSVLMADSSGLRLVLATSDLASLLYRFAAKQSFSVDCGGGGGESNAHLVPGLLQLAVHFAALCPEGHAGELAGLTRRGLGLAGGTGGSTGGSTSGDNGGGALLARARAVWEARLGQGVGQGAGPGAGLVPASWPAGMALGLVTLGGEEWASVRPAVLAHLLAAVGEAAAGATGQREAGQPGATHEMGRVTQLAAISSQPPAVAALRFFVIVDWLQQQLKGQRATGVQAQEQGTGTEGGAAGSSGSSGNPAAARLLPHLPGMRVRLSTLQLMHELAHAFLSRLATLDAAGSDVERLLALCDK